jgi:hypothetical protein
MSKNLDKQLKQQISYYKSLGDISKKAKILECLGKIKGIIEIEDDILKFNGKEWELVKKRGKRSHN